MPLVKVKRQRYHIGGTKWAGLFQEAIGTGDKAMMSVHEQELIEQHVEVPTDLPPDRAYLRDSGVDVWALVMYYEYAAGRDIALVAREYAVPTEAVEAALTFYSQHKSLIDARITTNLSHAA